MPRSNGPSVLYRFFAADGALLYVGSTANYVARLKQHATDKAWWTDVASTTLEHFPTRDAALAAEQAAILTEHPLHNRVHAVGKTPIRGVRVPDALWGTAMGIARSRRVTISTVLRDALEQYVEDWRNDQTSKPAESA